MGLNRRSRILAIGGGSVAAAVLGVCTSLALASTPAPGGHAIAVPSTTTPTTTEAETSTVPSSSTTTAPSTTGTTTAQKKPAATNAVKAGHVTPVPGCERGCTTVFTLTLGNGGRVDALVTHNPDITGLMAYWIGDTLIDSRGLSDMDPQSYDVPASGDCRANSRQCVLTYGTGVHSIGSILFGLDRDGIHVTDSFLAASPYTKLFDLDHDGLKDVVARDATYDPSYATGPKYWATYLAQGDHFTRTGCTAPVMDLDPAPTHAVTGPCPH